MQLAPIILFPYKRKDLTKIVIEYLLKNSLAQESDLIIFADGSKDKNDLQKVQETREYLKTISGFKSIELHFAKNNKGLANSIIDGVTQVLNRYEKAIILEDDVVVNENFLEYMNLALEKYENIENIACIHGYQHDLKNAEILDETFFLKGADCWGWATWKKVWNLVEWDGEKLLKKLQEQKLENEINFNGSYNYVQMLKDQIKGKNNSWAVRWYISCFLDNKLCLHPKKTLVQNIGIESIDGTHCYGKKKVKDIVINLQNHLPKLTNKIEVNQFGYKIISQNFYLFNQNKEKNFLLRIILKINKFLNINW